eukprot:scaffold30374_cov107-Isochrysis_galbana.AAC.5
MQHAERVACHPVERAEGAHCHRQMALISCASRRELAQRLGRLAQGLQGRCAGQQRRECHIAVRPRLVFCQGVGLDDPTSRGCRHRLSDVGVASRRGCACRK